MLGRDLAVVALWSLGTVAAVASFSPSLLSARDEAAGTRVPTLHLNGADLTLLADTPAGQALRAGQAPAVTLVASNPTRASVQGNWRVEMQTMGPIVTESRMGPAFTPTWDEEGELSLAPGETRRIALGSTKAVAAGQSVRFLLGPATRPSVQPVAQQAKPAGKLTAKSAAPAAKSAAPAGRNAEPAVANRIVALSMSAQPLPMPK